MLIKRGNDAVKKKYFKNKWFFLEDFLKNRHYIYRGHCRILIHGTGNVDQTR